MQATVASHSRYLTIRTNALATKVVFDERRRAIGVEYREGARVYAAHTGGSLTAGVARFVRAKREVILAGGAFNSPQLLQLSGIGPEALLRRHGIDVVRHLPGVGRNLQDHHEIGVTYRMKQPFAPLADCTYDPASDPCLDDFENGAAGAMYGSSGTLLGIVARSRRARDNPDLCLFALAGDFHGYYPRYSREVLTYKDRMSWVVLKAFTPNDAGTVEIRSADPRDVPDVHFRFFEEGSDARREDLEAMADGIGIVRRVMRSALVRGHVDAEVRPGAALTTEAQLTEYAGNEAWGHHASCTNKIGPRSDPNAVVDERFRVHGVEGLRVVDASVFPNIPGFFIALPTYLVSEKASDVIIADARG